MVEIPAVILKDQVRALVSSFSRAVEVVTGTSPFNTWTEQFRTSWMGPVPMVCLSRLRSKAVWQPQSVFYWTACGMEVGFSSDTTAPAEQVHVLSGILLSALVCLTLMSDAGAERFALVGSACFLCLFLLGIRREVKATVLGGPWRSLRSLCYSSEVFSCMGWCFGYFGLILIQVTHAGFSTAGLSGSKGGSTKMKKLLC